MIEHAGSSEGKGKEETYYRWGPLPCMSSQFAVHQLHIPGIGARGMGTCCPLQISRSHVDYRDGPAFSP